MRKILKILLIFVLFGFPCAVIWAQDNGKQEILKQNQNVEEKIKSGTASLGISKNGILFGFELNAGLGEIVQNGSINFLEPMQVFKSSKKFAFDGGLKVGYQHYFGLGLGIRAGGYIGVGNPIGQKLFIVDTEIDVESLYFPIKTGMDLEGLWDFWEEGKHTLNLSFGVGYRFLYYKTLKSSSNVSFFDVSFPDAMIHEIYPQIGLGYYYERHQISLSYKFGNLLGFKSLKKMSEIIERNVVGNLKTGKIWTHLVHKSYFSIGYSYRF